MPNKTPASFAVLVQALAACGQVVLAFNPRTGEVEARLEQSPHLEDPCPAPLVHADGDLTDAHLGIPGASRNS